MAFIHDRQECLTGVQDRSPWCPRTDLQVDFVMVYGTDASMPERIRVWREHGYIVHLMTGCAWGDYQDYLDGEWDGINHWDESQRGRDGRPIMHGEHSPYICPSEAFGRYLLERLKPAVDAGAEAIHLEEPEFWDYGGYGAGFKREWKKRYGEEWQPPHLSCENRHRASALKVYLFRRLISDISGGLKDYAISLGRELAVYVPTHSLINYTQWKILSPEGTLLDIPTVDGCIAQVWTGTSRAGNVYRGQYAERTFETAFLEYGIMQELVRGTGRRMWFLHDPVEDNPGYTWESFRDNYLKTVTASLMHPAVFHYETAPWPNRIFNGMYPKKGRRGPWSTGSGDTEEKPRPIPPEYAELICSLIQTLGDMEQQESAFLPDAPRIGLMMADSGMYERSFPDSVPQAEGGEEQMNSLLFAMLDRQKAGEDTREDSAALMRRIAGDSGLYHTYVTSAPFPHFFGLAMPLVKAGIPLRPVQTENITRFPDALTAFSALILSYEWMKPRDPQEHVVLADWVRRGGTLLLIGDGSDPYHAVRGWWNTEGRAYEDPAQHLCETLGLGRNPAEGVYPAGTGQVVIRRISPARITLTPEAADDWLRCVLTHAAPGFEPRNAFQMKRGPYRIAAVMKEGADSKPLTLRGCFADLYSGHYDVTEEKTIAPGETALLFDLNEPDGERTRPIASTARIESLTETETGYRILCRAAEGIRIRMRLRLEKSVCRAEARKEDGTQTAAEICERHEPSRTLLIGFPACGGRTEINLFTDEEEESNRHGGQDHSRNARMQP